MWYPYYSISLPAIHTNSKTNLSLLQFLLSERGDGLPLRPPLLGVVEADVAEAPEEAVVLAVVLAQVLLGHRDRVEAAELADVIEHLVACHLLGRLKCM